MGGPNTSCLDQECPAGEFTMVQEAAISNINGCTPCQAGSWSGGATSTSCSPVNCAIGKYTTKTENNGGAAAVDDGCIDCPHLEWSPGGAITECSKLNCLAG